MALSIKRIHNLPPHLSSGDVCRHRRISVQINAEVSNGADGRNVVGTDTERYGGNLVHA